jgi:hypothetical protein
MFITRNAYNNTRRKNLLGCNTVAHVIPTWPIAWTYIWLLSHLEPIHMLNLWPFSGPNWVTSFFPFSFAPTVSPWAPLETMVTLPLTLSQFLSGPYQAWFALLAACFLLVFCLAYSSNLQIEVIHSSETPVYFYRTTRCYNPDDHALHCYQCENLKSNIQ